MHQSQQWLCWYSQEPGKLHTIFTWRKDNHWLYEIAWTCIKSQRRELQYPWNITTCPSTSLSNPYQQRHHSTSLLNCIESTTFSKIIISNSKQTCCDGTRASCGTLILFTPFGLINSLAMFRRFPKPSQQCMILFCTTWWATWPIPRMKISVSDQQWDGITLVIDSAL